MISSRVARYEQVRQAPRPHVLVVDDDPGIRDVLRELLEDAGYRVELAADGLEALHILRDSPHRLVALVDLLMPRMGGVELLNCIARDRALRTRHAYLLMSAQPRALCDALADLLATYSIPVVLKPFEPEALLSTVRELASRFTWEAVH
jgi:CheY-like chemotaxis protein